MRKIIAETGIFLLEEGLVARTWGNISARTDCDRFLITPSGIDYRDIKESDIAEVSTQTGKWVGPFRPSGEWGVHAAAYRYFDDVNFVIHTHQNYASVLSVTGCNLPEGTALAEYALPGSKELISSVESKMAEGYKTIVMAHHGVLICGVDREDAVSKALELETYCGGTLSYTENAVEHAIDKGEAIYASLDDMAQIIGEKIPFFEDENDFKSIENALDKYGVALVKGKGIIAKAENEEEEKAIRTIAEKACLCSVNGGTKRLSDEDINIMHREYKNKYSKLRAEVCGK